MPSQQMIETHLCLSRAVDPFKSILSLESDVDDVFQKYFRRPYMNHSLEVNCDIYEAAKRMHLDEEEMWYKLVYTFTPVKHLQNFIFDTLDFITKGKRTVSIENWMRLVDLNYEQTILKKEWSFKPVDLSLTNYDILRGWVSNENGIYDMLFSMQILVKSSLVFVED